MATCEHPTNNHSTDLFTVYHGDTKPTILCGVHEQQGLNSALIAIRKAVN